MSAPMDEATSSASMRVPILHILKINGEAQKGTRIEDVDNIYDLEQWPAPWKSIFAYLLLPHEGQTNLATAEQVSDGLYNHFMSKEYPERKFPVRFMEALIDYQEGKEWVLEDRPDMVERMEKEKEWKAEGDNGGKLSHYEAPKIYMLRFHAKEFDKIMKGFKYDPEQLRSPPS